MIILINIILLILVLSLGIFAVLFSILVLDSLLRGHDIPTSRRAIKALSKIISQNKPYANNFYDLGCGRGTLSLAIKKRRNGNYQYFKISELAAGAKNYYSS